MYVKRYTIGALIFVALVGWYVYAFVTKDSMSLDLFGIPLPSLSIALWAVIPVILFYVVSVLHMSFYSMLGSFKLRKYEKDYELLINAIIDAFLGKEDRTHIFKTDRYSLLGSLIDNTSLFPTQTLGSNTSNEDINEVINVINSIKNAEVVDLKKYSLPHDNVLVIQNERNRYKLGEISSEDILSNSKNYAKSLLEEVYTHFVKLESLGAIEKYKEFLTKEALLNILSRVNASENTVEISNKALIALFESLELDVKDYLKISTILATQMLPEERMKLFESLSDTNEEAMDAYLFTLFDLEMLAPADEILEISQPEEYLNFKAYRALKDCNKHYNINLFI